MPDSNRINVTVYPADDTEAIEFEDVNFISLVNEETYGIPALISDPVIRERLPVKILYVNPQNIAAMLAERIA